MSPGDIIVCCDPLTLESEIDLQRISSKFEEVNYLVRILEVNDRQSKVFPHWNNASVTLASLTPVVSMFRIHVYEQYLILLSRKFLFLDQRCVLQF